MSKENQKIWTAPPDLREFVEEVGSGIVVPGGSGENIVISAGVLALMDMEHEERMGWLIEVLMPKRPGATGPAQDEKKATQKTVSRKRLRQSDARRKVHRGNP